MSRQRLGQHFLSGPVWQNRILEKLPNAPDDIWIEIGPGQGQMTQHLGRRAKRLIAIEADARLAENLRARIAANPANRPADLPNVEIVEGDVLTQDLGALAGGQKFRVYGSLPYYITSPILHHLFRWHERLVSAHVVTQLEVAERIAARPGTRDYGYLSVACQYYTHPEIVLKIPPGAFSPPPKVHSALVAMTSPGVKPTVCIEGGCVPEDTVFLRFVQACFAHKRKTLRNNLLALAGDEAVRGALSAAQLPENARAEQLSVAEFAILESKLRELRRN